MAREDKIQRLAHANDVILSIASNGRRFFYSPIHDRVARLEITKCGRVWLHDEHSGKRVYIYRSGRWPGFTHGGTMRSLIEAIRDYVRSGRPVQRGHFGPWRDGFELWGYAPTAMQAVREAVFKSPAVAQPNISHEKNDALIEFYGRWRLNGDWLICQGCKRPIIASRDGELMNHANGCKNSESQHPWTELRSLIAPQQ